MGIFMYTPQTKNFGTSFRQIKNHLGIYHQPKTCNINTQYSHIPPTMSRYFSTNTRGIFPSELSKLPVPRSRPPRGFGASNV